MKTWIRAALIRALKTFAQAMVAQIGAGSVGIVDFNWPAALSVSAMAAILSLFTSIAGLPEVELQNAIEERDVFETLNEIEVEEDENENDTAEE